MIVRLIKKSKIHNFNLPTTIAGNYWITDTDYLGNTANVTTYVGTTIKTVDFKANLSHAFKHLKEIYLNERTK